MGIREEMIVLLRTPLVASINFSFPSLNRQIGEVRVNQSSFERVARALETNRLNVTTNSNNLVVGASAQYTSENALKIGNTFIIPRLTTVLERGGVVHESIHASFDMTRSVLPQVDNEAAAYIGGCFYYASGNYRSFSDPIHHAAIQIVNEFGQTNSINPARLEELRNAINNNPTYSHLVGRTYSGDGTK